MNPIPFLVQGGISLVTGKLPRWVYIALAVAGLIALGLHLHSNAVKAAYKAAYNQGRTDERQAQAKAAAKLAIKQAEVTAPIRKKNDETNARIAADANDLRLRGPGKASACPSAAARARQPGSASDRPADAAGSGNAAADGMPDFAAVPWAWLVGRAENADLDRAEVIAWRDWYARQHELAIKPKQ